MTELTIFLYEQLCSASPSLTLTGCLFLLCQTIFDTIIYFLHHSILIFCGLYILWLLFCNICRKYLYNFLDNAEYQLGKSFTEHLINRTEGFTCKIYTCKTKDGCSLQMLRIVYDGNDSTKHSKLCTSSDSIEELLQQQQREQHTTKPVVLLQHGLLEAMSVFVLHKDSIAYQLARKGFDVWLGNNRTNWFGQQHLAGKLHEEHDFWKFSIDELIKYDVTAMIDFVRSTTKQSKICYCGQSQGVGQLFAALSLPESAHYKNYLSSIVALSPACFLRAHPNTFCFKLLMKLPHWVYGSREFLIVIAFAQTFAPNFLVGTLGESFMRNVLAIQHLPLPNDPLKAEWFKNCPLGCTSVNNVVHWFRMLRTGGCLRKFNDVEEYPIVQTLEKWKSILSNPNSTEHVPALYVFLGGKDNVIDDEASMKAFNKCCPIIERHYAGESQLNVSKEILFEKNSTWKIEWNEEFGHTDYVWTDPKVRPELLTYYDKIASFLLANSETM